MGFGVGVGCVCFFLVWGGGFWGKLFSPPSPPPPKPATANRETVLRQSSPQDSRLFIVRVTFARPRTAKHGDDKFFLHRRSSILPCALVFQLPFRLRHVELLEHRHAQPCQTAHASLPL